MMTVKYLSSARAFEKMEHLTQNLSCIMPTNIGFIFLKLKDSFILMHDKFKNGFPVAGCTSTWCKTRWFCRGWFKRLMYLIFQIYIYNPYYENGTHETNTKHYHWNTVKTVFFFLKKYITSHSKYEMKTLATAQQYTVYHCASMIELVC